MWYVMAKLQRSHELSDRLIRAISNWQDISSPDDEVELLLEMGADVNRLHGTLLPLHCACMAYDVECAQLLIERGAEVDTIDGYGRAAIHYAAERDVNCAELLLQNGADVNIRDANQATPLHWAAFKNNELCVRALLLNNACVDAVDFNNNTPLSWASFKGNLECVQILLDYNADVTTRNFSDHTSLMRSAGIHASGLNIEKDDLCLELLIRANGQFDVRQEDGRLPNILAADAKLAEMLSRYCTNTRSLKDLCRAKIRQVLGQRYLPNAVKELPIPPSLGDFILLQH